MLLDQPADSPFDLKFHIFRVPVRVHPFFWLVTVFLGFDYIKLGFEILLLWVACVFFSILLHELGHVWMGQVFGSRGHILMQGLGGLAIGASSIYGRWRRVAVYLAGPGIQFLFFGLLFATLYLVDKPNAGPADLRDERQFRSAMDRLGGKLVFEAAMEKQDYVTALRAKMSSVTAQPQWPQFVQYAFRFLLWINLWWPLMNLMPVWPLDGGQVSRELFTWISPQKGVRNSLALAVATGLVLTINALSESMGGPSLPFIPSLGKLTIFLFGAMTFNCFLMLQAEHGRVRGGGYRDPDDDDRLPWERDPDEWKRG